MHPNQRVASFVRKAVTTDIKQEGEVSKSILIDIINHKQYKGLSTNPDLGARFMLTRIAYQALGMVEELLPPISQEEVVSKIGSSLPRYYSTKGEEDKTLKCYSKEIRWFPLQDLQDLHKGKKVVQSHR